MTSICVIHGHPDASSHHFCTALGEAYIQGAKAAGHDVSEIHVGSLEFGYLSSREEFEMPPAEPVLSERKKIEAADHVVLIFPLWLGSAPAKLRGFLERAACGNFFLDEGSNADEFPKARMKGKSARLIVTMGMPGLVYKLYFGAHSIKGIEQGLLGLSGFKPIHHTIYGMVEADDEARHQKWLEEARDLGRNGK